ncbi:2-oxo-4-hydroxy-4-carboxy-5-ureidoimidazoline decarboxylase [Streptomyces xiamenensis]|uniref:2-oxo-4-hydroxy-4-carboxy-5-ureidoimidazoline decarboxylase n=1 Tax=Streptomyces xiamenensis TaxID=408015 RepID=UPI003D73C455
MPLPSPSAPPTRLDWFNNAPERTALDALHDICAAPSWAGALVSGRPYPGVDRLLAASDAATAELDATGIGQALAAHPPIGAPAPGDPASAREQRGMAGATPELVAEMHELNLAYQDRFGQVFLICATGLSGEQLRDALRARLDHTSGEEGETVRTELAKINRLRLTRLLATPVPAATTVSTHILDTAAGRPAAGVTVELSVPDDDGEHTTTGTSTGTGWTVHATAVTDPDGRCKELPPLPGTVTTARLRFAVSGPFFPEVTTTFAVRPGEHHHVPLLLSPFGYSVYRGS